MVAWREQNTLEINLHLQRQSYVYMVTALKMLLPFLQRKHFPKVTCHEWKWSCCQTSCEDLNLHPHERLQTVHPAVLTPSPLNPANITLLLPRTCATFGSAQICAVFTRRRALQRNYSQITEDEEKKNPKFKDFSTYRGCQRGHVGASLIRGCEQPRRLRAAGWNYRGGKSITVTNNSLLWQGKLHLRGPELLMSWYDAPYQPEECQRHQRHFD